MADNMNTNKNNGRSYNFLPKFYKSDANKKFLQATVDQLTQKGTVKKINGYIGRANAKASSGPDIFLAAPTTERQDYQLEPGLVIEDQIGNTTFFKDYQDYINQLGVFGSNLKNHERINKQESYSWDPHIDWDKFVNFQNYYWLPYGPEVIAIAGQQENIVSEYKITIDVAGGDNEYIFWPNGLTPNPTIKLYRGQTYKFNVESPSNPISIKITKSPNALDRYSHGVTNNGITTGVLTFTVPYDAPDVLYYVSETDLNLGGSFTILSIDENTSINVETDVLGKQNYTLPDGTPLSNGMKVRFIGDVTPVSYATGFYYVEGVGNSIKLINESVLEVVSDYTVSESVLFDTTPFDTLPFSDATSFSGTRDYIVINRGSQDHNAWSRNNRWFHKDVIETSSRYNGLVPDINQTSRAVRPIIEFEPDLKLFNFGNVAINDVDLVDTFTTDVFSTIEGSLGYNVDGISLAQGQRVLFTADTDRLVKNQIYKVTFTTIKGRRQVHLELDTTPTTGNVVLVKQGKSYQGSMFWYDGSTWAKGQHKSSLNQAPLFDMFDSTGHSYGDIDYYDGSTFTGTPIFSYKIGTSGSVDSNLGFILSHKNINNIGDIVFNFNLLKDTFTYKSVADVLTTKIDAGYLQKTDSNQEIGYVNGWQTCNTKTIQAAVRIYKNSNKTNNFDIDMYDNVSDLSDLVVKVYVNGIRLDQKYWTIANGIVYKQVVLATDISASDVLTIRSFAAQPINENAYYEIPFNLQNNPLNEEIQEFTLGEVVDHVNSIIDNLPTTAIAIRDYGNVTQYGTRFLQHSGPLSLSLYHITSETNNVVRAIELAREEYNKFKRNFIKTAESLGVDTDIVSQVELILDKINKNKPKTFPYYFSDMVPYGANTKTTLPVVDYRIKTYPLTNVFNLDTLSTKAVGVYLNDTQLLYKRDYTFSDQGFVIISADLTTGDIVTIIEYDNTNGSFVPPTPTKLGIWPAYEPKIFVDTSLITPRTMIQGHDGSVILAYGDYRDDLILELEKRIFNNIKVEYDATVFDIYDIIPAYNRTNDYSLEEFNEVLAPNFYKWLTMVDADFTKPLSYDRNNPMTYNYKGHSAPDGRETPGYWRGIYRWLLDTDRPNIAPWEMLGFSIEPTWWTSVYGPAPYTKDNIPMWTDISTGTVREPGKPAVILDKFVRPYLLQHIPVDEQGNIASPLISGLSEGIITPTTSGDFTFGDVSPIEAAWRRSSYYPFSVLITSMLLTPAKTFGTLLDRSRIVRNLAGQLVYADTNLRIKPSDVVLPSIFASNTLVQTSGIINYIVDYILSDNLKSYNSYLYDLDNISAKLSYRVGAFTSKEKFNLILDSKTPLSQGSVFVPQEDYKLILNSSSPIKKISYSAVIITRLTDGFEIKGYSLTSPYFKYYTWSRSGITINVGGISESYSVWTGNVQYAAGKIVEYNNRYYRATVTHTTTSTFNASNYQILSSLPIIGGKDAILRKSWDRLSPVTIPYGTKFKTVQEVVDFLQGYGEYLKDQGFVFDEFNPAMGAVTNWETSAKEFLFWTTQNWSTGEDKWKEWLPQQTTLVGEIVRYNGDYFRALRNSAASDIFIDEDFVKLDGLSTVGSSVISLSPGATGLTFSTPLSVVDSITNQFNNYEILKVDGTPLEPNFINSYREDNTVNYSPRDDHGIFAASFYLVQQEHVVILNNSTMFNDTIYNPVSGYRQERIKVSGYVSTNWYGGFDVPGFIFDQAKIQIWQPWQDYSLGDIVKYKEFYYIAQSFISGTEVFEPNKWFKDTDAPTQELLPNWSYKAEQFTDFYSLDSDNFDSTQQQLAQHLIGYQKRQYLENIIKDDVSEFKFYQGMIAEKGTQNVLNKLFDVLSASDQESLAFFEEWALRIGQYGANSAYDNIEFTLDESKFKNNPQGFNLVTTPSEDTFNFIIEVLPNDVYLKPLGYNNNPWPALENSQQFLRSAGYVRSSDVNVTISSIDEILTQDIALFNNGDYVWCGFEGPSWNVYRYSHVNITIMDVTYDNSAKTITVSANQLIEFAAGSYIGISQVTGFTGFYKVDSVDLNKFVVTAPNASVDSPFTENEQMLVFVFKSQRVSSIDVADQIFTKDIKSNELLWTDNDGTGKWSVWQHNSAYTESEIVNTLPQVNLRYGRKVLLNRAGNITAISNSLGEVVLYDKASPISPWVQRQTILPPYIAFAGLTNPTPNGYTGDVLAISDDGNWFATGTPLATGVASYYNPTNYGNGAGVFAPLHTYSKNEIIYFTSSTSGKTGYYQSLVASNYNRPPDVNPSNWQLLQYIPVDPDATNSALTNQGVISLYKKDANNIFTLVDTILSPNPASNELFGSSIVFGKDTMFVSAPGSNSGAGKVYQISYLTTVKASAFYNPPYSANRYVTVSSTAGITEGMAVVGHGFTSGQYVVSVVNGTTLYLNAAPDLEPTGLLQFTLTQWQYVSKTGLEPTAGVGETISNYGNNLAISYDGQTLLVDAPSTKVVNNVKLQGRVYIYDVSTTSVVLNSITPSITGSEYQFGSGITISDNGEYIALSSILADGIKVDQGKVSIYKKISTGGYYLYQDLTNIRPEAAEFFGTKVSFMNNYNTIVVYSQNADSIVQLTLDDNTTTFDNDVTRYITTSVNGGTIDVYDRYGDYWIYGETLENNTISTASYGSGFSVGANSIFIGAPSAIDQGIVSGKLFEYRKLANTYSWTPIHYAIERPDVKKIKQIFLYNKTTNKLVKYLDVVDVTQGKIPGPAEQEIKYKTFYDPATYSVGNSTVRVDDGMAWNSDQVGMLWWDLSTAKFLDSYDNDIVYRNSNWNTLFPGASIDIYEWVGSTLTPEKWNEQSDTEAGLVLGISGTTLYDNSVYSVVNRYDNVSKTLKKTYYYWVKNKATIPAVPNRALSAKDVAALIENPRGQGYEYVALTGADSFSLINVKPLLQDSNIVLSVEYWITENFNRNIHTEWKLISTDSNSEIPSNIEQKWVDSLCGKDVNGRVIPDLSLPLKLRYGIENRPRQSMFINRFEALKQVIEQANRVLIEHKVSESRNLSLLESYDAEPNIIKGLYDSTSDTDAELRFNVVSTFKKPSLTPIIVDGKITGVTINDKGNGYLVAPYIDVTGNGIGAKIRAIINAKGQITGAIIESSGKGYGSSTALTVRNYSVLVHSDSAANGNWSIYSYEPTTQVWSRIQTQTFDTRNYWEYVDWFATGYNQFTAPDYAVSSILELSSIDVEIGQIVKLMSNNSSSWTLLYKYSNVGSSDWTQNYQIVGLQNGTIQFNSSLYQFAGSVYGYDGSLYDGSIFDNVASLELRNILTALKDNIFIDDLKSEYLKLFFTSVRYALSEQNYVDWAVKTSFVKVQHNVGQLKQKVTYNNDNLTDFESYIDEVKPYRTNVREYISNYKNVDSGNMSVTDFDLQPVYENGQLVNINTWVENGKLSASDNNILSYPWKHWLDNAGYTVTSLTITNGGSGYISEPVVRFISNSGTGATARAFIANGVVNRIVLLTPGSGYLSAPTIYLDGGLLTDGTQATAVATIGDGVVRSTLVKMKFDRTTKTYFLNELQQTETFTGSGSRLQFPLIWGPDIKIGNSTVTINGIPVLRDTYKLSIVKSTARGYTSYSGSITFDTAPTKGSAISVTYYKDWSLLNAADRIQFYYNPTSGELGKDLAQLMTGIDYGGVVVSGLGFDVSAGWGELPYYSDKWDSFDPTFDDYIVTVSANTHSFTLPYVPEAGTEINVYYLKYNKDTYTSDGTTTTFSYNVYDTQPLEVVATITRTVSQLSLLGSSSLVLDSVVGLKVGDVLTIPTVPNGVAFNATIVSIIPSTRTVVFNQIFFANIASGRTAIFTRTLFEPTDYFINATGLVELTSPLVVDATLTIGAYFTSIRIDDPDYNTPDQTNQSAVMLPYIADGAGHVVTIPGTFTVNTNDKFILRKSTSDGSINPQDTDYDTALSGGNLAYSSATGITPDEIIIDGDGFVTQTVGEAPEEVVPGQVVDTLAIKVYDRPITGTANIKVDSFVADGVNKIFMLSQQPDSKTAIIVKTTVGITGQDGKPANTTLIKTNGVDYTFDYRNKSVVFNTAPTAGYTISVFSFGFNGTNILDLDYFVGDASTREFITKAPWVTPVSYVVYVDGVPATVELFKTDSTYESANRIGIRFIEPPATSALINFVIVGNDLHTFSITNTQTFTGNGTNTYVLSNSVGDLLPLESNMIVRVDQTILLGPNNSYFKIKNNKLTYTVDPTKFLPYTVSSSDILVLADGVVLTPVIDYILDLGGISVKINKSTYTKYSGKELLISIKQGSGYSYVPSTGQLLLSDSYDNTHVVEVITSYKHDILDIQRTAVNITSNLVLTPDTPEYYNYKSLTYGALTLDRAVIDENYVWVIKNGTLLTPSIDFKLNEDLTSISLANQPDLVDEFTIITFGTNVLTSGIAYMQFKDMLNRVVFKRLSLKKQTKLANDLHQTDTTITVEDASNFDAPSPTNNKPGIIEIAGERIEYFTLNGNVLGQLRRGTLGTGVRTVHKAGSFVQDIGASETISYTETSTVVQADSNGTNIVNLTFTPTKAVEHAVDLTIGRVYTIVDLGTTDWNIVAKTTNVSYSVGSTFTARVQGTGTGTAEAVTYGQSNDIEVFAGGVRLKKKPFKVYSASVYPESPEGDVQFDAEFSVNGTSNQVRLTTPAPYGTRITVVKRLGTAWDSITNIQYDTSNITQFLKATPGIWYNEFKD